MRLMAVSQCHSGDVAADTIRGRHGQVIAEKAEPLTDHMIQRMKDESLDTVAVEWPGLEKVHPNWWFPDTLVRPMTMWAQRGMSALDGDGLATARQFARDFVDRFPLTHKQAFQWIPLYRAGNPALAAWVNTIGLTVKLTQLTDVKWVEDYTMAAILLGLEYALTQAEVGLPSAERLSPVVSRLKNMTSIPSTARVTVQQHHAHWDGTGDPPLKDTQIYQGALIVGMAESMNALLFRTDEPPVPINEALEWMVGGAGLEYSLTLVQLLQRTVAPYSVGSVVTLGQGEIGVVLNNPPDWPTRPQVWLLNGRDAGHEVQLKDPDQHIRVITGLYSGRELPG